MITSIIVIFLALGGGASFVAESAVPGDPLYVVKTSVNEQVMGIVYSNPQAHANWEATLATRRAHEAAELQLRGTLTTERATKLNAEFASHADEAVKAAENIGSSGQDGVSLATSIRAKLNAVIEADHELFAPRDAATGKATGKSAFVLPHVLEATYEVKAPRDSASGQATGKIMVPPADVDGDGVVKPAPATTPGAKIDLQNTEATLQGGAGAEVETTQLKPTYDVKATERVSGLQAGERLMD